MDNFWHTSTLTDYSMFRPEFAVRGKLTDPSSLPLCKQRARKELTVGAW